MDAVDNRSEVREFLTTRRAKITPQQAGLPDFGQRRVPGLRRGEVAAVYVLGPDNRPSLRQLRLGDAVGEGEIEVLAGLAAGDKVATDPVKAAIVVKQSSNK